MITRYFLYNAIHFIVILVGSSFDGCVGENAWGGSEVVAATEKGVAVGETIDCIEGYVVDFTCINNEYLLDAPTVKTLEHPEQHSIQFLIDVPFCYLAKYEILLDPPAVVSEQDADHDIDNATSAQLYKRGYRLDFDTKMSVMTIARNIRTVAQTLGLCQTEDCNGNDETWLSGMRVKITNATIIAPADDTDGTPPTITADTDNIQYASPFMKYCTKRTHSTNYTLLDDLKAPNVQSSVNNTSESLDEDLSSSAAVLRNQLTKSTATIGIAVPIFFALWI